MIGRRSSTSRVIASVAPAPRRATLRSKAMLLTLALLPAGLGGCAVLAGGAALGAAGGVVASRDIRVRSGVSVRVAFARPRDVALVGARGDTTVVQRVESLVGRAEHVQGDSIWLIVSESRSATARETYPRDVARAVVDSRSSGATITPLANRPAYVTAGALAGAAAGVGVIIVRCLMEPCMR